MSANLERRVTFAMKQSKTFKKNKCAKIWQDKECKSQKRTRTATKNTPALPGSRSLVDLGGRRIHPPLRAISGRTRWKPGRRSRRSLKKQCPKITVVDELTTPWHFEVLESVRSTQMGCTGHNLIRAGLDAGQNCKWFSILLWCKLVLLYHHPGSSRF